RRHTRFSRDWSSDVCSSDLLRQPPRLGRGPETSQIEGRDAAQRVAGVEQHVLTPAAVQVTDEPVIAQLAGGLQNLGNVLGPSTAGPRLPVDVCVQAGLEIPDGLLQTLPGLLPPVHAQQAPGSDGPGERL